MMFDHHRLEEMYISLPDALAELDRRRQDPVLCQRVLDFFGADMLEPMLGDPKLVYARHITSPNFEFDRLWSMIHDVPLPLFLFESSTKFVTKNLEKLNLARLAFAPRCDDLDSISQVRPTHQQKIVDFDTWQGHNIHDVMTLSGEKLLDVHHHALYQAYPDMVGRTICGDYFDWFVRTRGMHADKYTYFYSLFITHGILFENYDLKDTEEGLYVYNYMLPSFVAVSELFGVKPLIVPIVDTRYAHESYWYWYNSDIMNLYGVSN